MKYFLTALAILFSLQVHAADWEESQKIGALFKDAGVNGTFVLYDVSAGTYTGHNRARAEERFIPASTFKIANALIGLSSGTVKSVDEMLPYGGKPQAFKSWEKDMGLREAIAISNVPIFQELARRIGLERMRESIAAMDYGNGEIGTRVDRYWLSGPLKISAVEQTRFLARLTQDALPLSPGVQKSVREIVLVEHAKDWKLYGKTGWQNAPDAGIGWWVGWVEKNGHIYAFALNMDMQQASDANKRIELGKASLKALGIL